MKNKVLTYEEFMALAQANYSRGGMDIVECWDEGAFNEYVKEFGPITLQGAENKFRFYAEIDREEEAILSTENW